MNPFRAEFLSCTLEDSLIIGTLYYIIIYFYRFKSDDRILRNLNLSIEIIKISVTWWVHKIGDGGIVIIIFKLHVYVNYRPLFDSFYELEPPLSKKSHSHPVLGFNSRRNEAHWIIQLNPKLYKSFHLNRLTSPSIFVPSFWFSFFIYYIKSGSRNKESLKEW